MRELGCDLTAIELKSLEKLFNKYSIGFGPKRDDKLYAYVFTSYKDDTIEIRMGAIPFARGLLFDTQQGTRGDGYCSYMNIKGSDEFMEDFIKVFVESGNSKSNLEVDGNYI